jgi:hypothetical protein
MRDNQARGRIFLMLVWSRRELCTTDEINQSKVALVSRINGYLAGVPFGLGTSSLFVSTDPIPTHTGTAPFRPSET